MQIHQDVKILNHIQGWWHYQDAIRTKKEGVLLTSKATLVYEQLMRLWNDNGKPEVLTIYRNIIMEKSLCNSGVTYAKSMKALHQLGLIHYNDKSNEHRACTVIVKRLDEIYTSWRSENNDAPFPVDLQDKKAEKVGNIQDITQGIVDATSTNVPDTKKDIDTPISEVTQQQVDAITPLLIDYINEKCDEIGITKPVISNNEQYKAKELIRIIAGGVSENLGQRIQEKINQYAEVAKNDKFLRERFYPSGMVIMINRFESAANKKEYPLKNKENIPVTSLNGTPFPSVENSTQDDIKNVFKDFKKDKKTEKANNANFTQYLNYHNLYFIQGYGWQKQTNNYG